MGLLYFYQIVLEVEFHPFLNSPLNGESDQVYVTSHTLYPVIEGAVHRAVGPQRRCGRDGEVEYPHFYWYRIQMFSP